MRIVRTPLPVALGTLLTLVSGCSALRPLQKPPGVVDISSVVQQIQEAIDPFWESEKNGASDEYSRSTTDTITVAFAAPTG